MNMFRLIANMFGLVATIVSIIEVSRTPSHSQLPSTIHHFTEFSHSRPTEEHTPCNNSHGSLSTYGLIFEVAEIALEAAMKRTDKSPFQSFSSVC